MVRGLEAIERTGEMKPHVGIVGETFVEIIIPDANINHAIDVIENEGGEAVMPACWNFYTANTAQIQARRNGETKAAYKAAMFGIWLVNWFRKPIQVRFEKQILRVISRLLICERGGRDDFLRQPHNI